MKLRLFLSGRTRNGREKLDQSELELAGDRKLREATIFPRQCSHVKLFQYNFTSILSLRSE